MTIAVHCSGQGIPLVMFHGWGFDSRIWASILPLLEKHCEVYRVDLPGFGLSAYLPWEAFKRNLLNQLPAQFAVAGWSLGGLFATRLAIEEPQTITHLVNIASSPCFVESLNWPGIPESTLLSFQDRLTNNPESVLREFLALQLPRQSENAYPYVSREGLQAGLESLLTWDYKDQLSLIECPMLYLFGSRDEIVTLKTMKVMQDCYPQFKYILFKKALHAIFLTHPVDSVESILHFLSS